MAVFSAPSVQIEGVEFTLENKIEFEVLNKAIEQNFEKALKSIAHEVKDFWQTEAGKRLKTSRDAYVSSLTVVNNGDGTFAVTVGGKGGRASKGQRWLAKAREMGTPSFDMKPGLLKSKESRVIRMPDGEFRTVARSQYGKWIHPGVPAANMKADVVEYLQKKLIPKYMKICVDDAVKAFNASLVKGSGK